MKNLKRIGKYFALIFGIVLVCSFIGIVIKEVDKGIFYDLSTKDALSLCVQLELAAWTTVIPYSLCVATFLAFWAMNSGKWTDFFRALAVGLVFVLPLSAITCYYDWSVRPQIITESAEELIEMKNNYPQELADKFGIDKEQVLDELPVSMPGKTLIARMDSLETSFQAKADTCGQLLSLLPDTLASEAYKSYRLKDMGIAYRYAAHPLADKDSLVFVANAVLYQRAIQSQDTLTIWAYINTQDLLYQHATQSWDILSELRHYRKEYFNRTLNTACIYIVYLAFAFFGYLLRYKPIKKILAVVAVLIATYYFYQEIGTLVQKQVQKVREASTQIVDKTYEGMREIRKKEN